MPVRLLQAVQGQAANTLFWGTTADENALLGLNQADNQIELASDYSPYTRIVTAATANISRNAMVYQMNSATAQTLTLSATGYFPLGSVLTVIQIGAGATTVVAGTGVTISTALTSLVTKGVNNIGQLIKTGPMTWIAYGGFGG